MVKHPGRFGYLDLALSLLVLASAIGVRWWYVAVYADNGNTGGPIQVQDRFPAQATPGSERRGKSAPTEFDVLVDNIKQQKTFSSRAPFATGEERTAHIAPGYPWVAVMLEQSPVDLGPVDPVLRWLQVVLGGLTALVYALFARRAFGNRTVSLLAGLLCAFSPFLVVSTAELADGVLTSFLLACALYLGARGGQAGGAFTSLLYGVSLACLGLVRAAMLPFAGVAVLWYVLRCRSARPGEETLRRGWLAATLAFLGFVTTLVPWSLRNFQTFHDLIPVTDSLYLHLWEGNSPGATGDPRAEAELLDALADARGETIAAVAERLAAMEQPARYRSLAQDVWREVRTNPGPTVRRRIRTTLIFFLSEEWLVGKQPYREDPSEGKPAVDRAAVFQATLLGMLWLGFAGWRWTYGWRFEAMPSGLAMFLVPLPWVLGHGEHLNGPRLPLDGLLLTYAAFAVVAGLPWLGGGLLRGGRAELRDDADS